MSPNKHESPNAYPAEDNTQGLGSRIASSIDERYARTFEDTPGHKGPISRFMINLDHRYENTLPDSPGQKGHISRTLIALDHIWEKVIGGPK